MSRNIIIFDGVCHFCNGAVNFIIKRDPSSKFKFTPMQSNMAQELLTDYGLKDARLDTFILIKDGVFYERTDAALEVAKELTGYWFMFRIFKVIPRPIRDYFYDLFASNRYKLFGKRGSCMVPTPEIQDRFI